MSELYKVVYSPYAANDLKDIYSYIAYSLREPQTAKRIVNRIQTQARKLDSMPERFAVFENSSSGDIQLRKVPVGNYLLLYGINNANHTVTIYRILYGGRDLSGILSDS